MAGYGYGRGYGARGRRRPSGGTPTPTPTPAPVITFDGTTFANTLGNPGPWQADGVAIPGETGATMAYVEATMAGRAIQQSVGGVLSNAIVALASGPPTTLIDFTASDGTKLSALGWAMMGGAGATAYDKFTVVGNEASIAFTAAGGTPATAAIAVRDTGSTTHSVEADVVSASYNQCASLLFKVGNELSYLQCQFNGTDALLINQYDNSGSGVNQTPNLMTVAGLSTVGSKYRLVARSDNKWQLQIKLPGDADFKPYGKPTGGFGSQCPQIDEWYDFSAGLAPNTGIGLRARGSSGTGRIDNVRYSSLERPILIVSTSIGEEIVAGVLKRFIQLDGTCTANLLNNAEVLLIDSATGELLTDWTAATGAPGAGTSFSIKAYFEANSQGRNVKAVLRDTVNKGEASAATIDIPIYQTIFAYRAGINESFSAGWAPSFRERNIAARVDWRFPSSAGGWGYWKNELDVGETDDGQYHTYPALASSAVAYISLPPKVEPGIYSVTYPVGMTVTASSLANVTVTQAFSGGYGEITVTGPNAACRVDVSGPIPPEGIGVQNVIFAQKDGQPTSTYLSVPFKTAMAAGKWKIYRNMTPDDINGDGVYRDTLNTGGQANGPLSAAAWAEISYQNGTTDLYINIGHLYTVNYVQQFAAVLKLLCNPLSKIYIEFSNEVWNQAAGFSQHKWFRYEGCKAGLYVPGTTPAPLPTLRYFADDATIDRNAKTLKQPVAAGEYIFADLNGIGWIVLQALTNRAIGDSVPSVSDANWTLISGNDGSERARQRQYSECLSNVIDIFDTEFGAERIIPVVAWQTGSFSAAQPIYEWNDLYLKMVDARRPTGSRGAIAPYWGGDLGVWHTQHLPGWGPTEKAWLVSTDPTTRAAGKAAFWTAAQGLIDAKILQTATYKHELARWLVSKGQSKDAIQLMSYELNWHTEFWGDTGNTWPDEIYAVFGELIRSPEMGTATQRYATGMAVSVGGDHVLFDRTGSVATGGLTLTSGSRLRCWGLQESEADIGADNYRFQAAKGVA